MVSPHLSEPKETQNKVPSPNELELEGDNDSGIEDELRQEGKDSTIFLAFKGNIGDEDFKEKLTTILHNVPNLISMESSHLKVQKVEPWNSVRVTFNIPREAAERLRLLAQSNNQQLRDLGILSVQIEGEGAINLALSQNRGQEVRMNGPLGANNTMRMDAGFAMQSGTGLIRMNNPAAPMMSQGPHVSSAMMAASGSSEMQPRTPRPSQQDAMDPLTSSMTVQQQGHPSGSMVPQLHSMQTAVANRPINPANFQQFQQQARLPQHQQIAQGLRPSFATPAQIPVPPGWNQLASGALQPPPAQGALGAVNPNQGWKKSPLSGGPMQQQQQQQQQQQFQQRPSLSTVQTPSHPPPPYPFGSQQASQAHANFSSISTPNQFNAPPMKPLQGNPARAPTPLQQPHLTSKSPASSPSSFQQSSPASSPTVNQTQQQAMGPRSAQGGGMQQSFQQQPVSSPSRGGMMPQVTSSGNFMMQQQNQGPQGMHTGVPKRLPPGFPSAQGNVNFVAGQTPPSMAGSPVNGTALQQQQQQQGNGTGQGAGGQANGSSHNQMQGTNGGPNLMQTNLMALHNNLNNQQAGGSGVSQVSVTGLHAQAQQGPQSQLMGMHQQIISSQGQMVSLQGQAPLNTQGQLVLSRTPLMTQGQMMGASQNQNLGQVPQRVTPPKPMIPSHNQLMTSQGQALMQQNPAVEQILQGKQGFNTQNQAGAMSGPSSIIRGQAPNMTNNMVQFSGQAVSQQGSVSTNPPQGMNMQGQVLRQTVPGQHLQQPLGETANQAGGDLSSMMPDLSMQQTGNMAAQHLQNMSGNSGPGQHFSGHGLPFSSPFSQGGNGSQMTCGQNPSFPVNKDVTLTSPLLVNLLQSDISAGHFGVNNKQGNASAAKPKKKKPPRKKKNQQGDEQMSSAEVRMDDSDQTGMAVDQGGALDGGQKLSEFANRPPGYPAQALEQRQLQQIPPQLMQLGQQQGQGGQAQQPTPPQQMMMMLMMQQEQKPVRLPVQQGVFNPRPAMTSDAQRMPMQQGANMPVMVSLQGSGPIPPSPDKQRMPMAANVSLAGGGRKMSFPESGQNQSGSPLGEGSSAASLPDVPELPATPGPQSNMAPHLLLSQNQMMMAGSKPGAPSSMSMVQGASPQQQQHSNAMPGSHSHHFQSVQTPSQTSRPKTPNRASPRPYYPQTPNNRPPSTEPSEISLSPERLNASIAGLFPPQINIPLPPRPTLNRGFDQQGLNPTTLKAIGQAPPGLTVNNQSNFGQHINKVDNGAAKQSNAGGSKRASPSNSRRSSPASSRKTTPSPGRQNTKAAKMVLGAQQNPGLLHSMEMQRNLLAGQTSVQNPALGSTIGQYPPVCMPTASNPADDIRESPSVTQESSTQAVQMGGKDPGSRDINAVCQEKKVPSPEESARKDSQSADASKAYVAEDNKTGISPAMRDAPTSLSQLLDHSNAPQSHHTGASPSQHSNGPSLIGKPTGPINERSPNQMPTEDPKIADLPALSGDVFSTEATGAPNPPQNTEPCTTQARPDALDLNPNVSMNLPPSTLKRTGGPTSLSGSLPPNQITVFVTSNPMAPSASVSAPMTSHLQQTLVPTVVNMPNMSNKAMVSEAQQSAPSSARPQFITPVFFNSSSIIQVMKGSQSNMPPSTMAPNTNMMSQSVTVVGPLHISQNIPFPPGQPSSTSPSNITSSTSTTRPVHATQMQTTSQLALSPSLLPAFPAHTLVKESGLEDTNAQSCAPPDLCSPKSLQPTPSPIPDSSQCSSASGKRILSAPSNDHTLDKFSQLLLVKAGNKVADGSGEDKLPADLESSHTAGTEAGNTAVPPSIPSQPVTEISRTSLSLDPTCPASSPPADIMASPSDIHPPLEGENGSRNIDGTEQVVISPEDNPPEQHPDKAPTIPAALLTVHTVKRSDKSRTDRLRRSHTLASPQCAIQEEGPVRDKESVPEKAEADPPETTESEPAERSRPPSRRNSKVDETPASQDTAEGGQRKRSARPSSASGSNKESGASPPQPKRRKSK